MNGDLLDIQSFNAGKSLENNQLMLVEQSPEQLQTENTFYQTRSSSRGTLDAAVKKNAIAVLNDCLN
ncbi:hypothetical protein QJS10_CPB22g00430 [Acorus calamus]|uniref:Uncharacterized protein n=1 Tax=Acorus calamus TaxID=4465 RepID=A0AAV9C1U5_ACOCL|nr:hypothetical protein QJS10_CPB22g00438 [Acorus calamus]KAK1282575.1 hypothetical protein QJS10_CPB22g00430 [Acorus calamus]